MHSAADECDYGDLLRYTKPEVLFLVGLPADEDTSFFKNYANDFIAWLNESRLNGTSAKIDRQYRDGKLAEGTGFDWYLGGDQSRTIVAVDRCNSSDNWKAILSCGHAVYTLANNKPKIGSESRCPVHPRREAKG